MGGAHVLLAEASRPTFCAIVSDSAFATFLDAGLDRIGGRSASATPAAGWDGPPPTPASATCASATAVNLLDADPAAAIAPRSTCRCC